MGFLSQSMVRCHFCFLLLLCGCQWHVCWDSQWHSAPAVCSLAWTGDHFTWPSQHGYWASQALWHSARRQASDAPARSVCLPSASACWHSLSCCPRPSRHAHCTPQAAHCPDSEQDPNTPASSASLPASQPASAYLPEGNFLLAWKIKTSSSLGNAANISAIVWAATTPSPVSSESQPWGGCFIPTLSFLGYPPSALGYSLEFPLHL